MKKLLITGFEPFGGEEINPSWEAVACLPREIGGYTLHKLRIPVTFGGAADCVIRAAEDIRPDVILCIGQAGGRSAITPELVAINLRHASIPDNAGAKPEDEPIAAGGAAAYFSTVPVRGMAEAIGAAGIPSQVSYSAGAYVCNDVLYTLLAHFCGGKTEIGFVHVPYTTAQNKVPAMTLEEIVRGLTAAIGYLESQNSES